jgi:hypothetical protein
MNQPFPSKDIARIHALACKEEKIFYTDPTSGLLVQTEYAHKKRGHCCKSGCRHCPFGYSGKEKKE